MRQSPAVLAQPCDSAFNPMPFFFGLFFPFHRPLHVDTVSLKTYINVLEIWMRSHACEHSRASMLSVLAVFRPSPTAENIPFVWMNKHSNRWSRWRGEKKKDLCTSLAFWQLCKQFIFTNHVVICVCKWSKFLFVVRLRGSGWNVSLESINVESEITFLFCAVWLRGASAKREDNTVCSS